MNRSLCLGKCSFVLVQNMVVPLSWHDKLAQISQKLEKLKIPKSSLRAFSMAGKRKKAKTVF